MAFPVTDISSLLGLCATVVLTANFLLGILLGTTYRKNLYWKKLPAYLKKISIMQIHNFTAYLALGLVLLHPAVLLFDKATKFDFSGIALPFFAPVQQVWVAVGIVSMYSILLVVITTQKVVRRMMGYRAWKNIHLISYLTLILICLHGLFMDPELKSRPPDFIDAEKLLSEICLLMVLSAGVLRYRHYRRQQAPRPDTAE